MGIWFSKTNNSSSSTKDMYMYFEPSSKTVQTPHLNHFTSSSVSDFAQLGRGQDVRKNNYNPHNYGNYCHNL